MKEKKKTYGLLEAWIGYIYDDHDCPAGIKALEFLRTCIESGKVSNEEIWAAASDEIKTGFYSQFGKGSVTKKKEAISKLVPKNRIPATGPKSGYRSIGKLLYPAWRKK